MTIPRGPQDVTPAWLGSVLGAEVGDVEVTPIGTGQTGATYRVQATYAEQPHRLAGHVRGQAVRPGRRRPRARRTRLPIRGRVLRASGGPHEHPGAALLSLRDLRRRSGLRAHPRRHGARGAGRPDRRMQRGRRPGWRSRPWPGLHGPSWCDPEWMELTGIAMPKPGDDAAAGGLGEISQMAGGILVDKLGGDISEEDKETLTAAMSLVTPWLMAEPDRYALMHGDYRLDNMLFDPDRTRITVVDWQTVGHRATRKGPRVFHRDEPGSRRPIGDRAGSGRAVPSGATWLWHNGLRLRHLLA